MQKNPTKQEYRLKNNSLTIHTCADSCRALGQLINYIASNRDLHEPPADDASSCDLQGSTSVERVDSASQLAQSPTEPPPEVFERPWCGVGQVLEGDIGVGREVADEALPGRFRLR